MYMADSPPHSDDDSNLAPDPESTTSTPRWVKVFGIITIVVVLLFVIMLLIGGGRHGPGRHTPSAGVIEGGRTTPEGGL
jgi:hypothetical protein